MRAWACIALLAATPAFADAGQILAPEAKWTSTAPFTDGRASLQAVTHRGRIYVLGGYSWSATGLRLFNDVQLATPGPDGAIAANGWRKTTPFAVARSGHGAVVYGGNLYVIGGGNGGAAYYGDVQRARLDADGTIAASGWQTEKSHLNTPRSVFGALVQEIGGKPFLFVIGGVTGVGHDTVHLDTIEYAPILSDGSVGPFAFQPFHFKGGRSAPAAFFAGGALYVIGGWGDLDDDIFGDVQYAPVRSNGMVEPWHGLRSLNVPRYGATAHYLAAFGSILVLGGNAGAGTYLDTVQAAPLEPDRGIGEWSTYFNLFTPARWGHASVVLGNRIYLLGGASRGSVFLDSVQFIPMAMKTAKTR